MLKAGLSLNRATINEDRIKLHLKREFEQASIWLKDNLNENDFQPVTRVANIAAHKTYLRIKVARSYFSKFIFIFHLKDHHTKDFN